PSARVRDGTRSRVLVRALSGRLHAECSVRRRFGRWRCTGHFSLACHLSGNGVERCALGISDPGQKNKWAGPTLRQGTGFSALNCSRSPRGTQRFEGQIRACRRHVRYAYDVTLTHPTNVGGGRTSANELPNLVASGDARQEVDSHPLCWRPTDQPLDGDGPGLALPKLH